MTGEFLPIHLAVHFLSTARRVPGGVATRSEFGPYAEALADRVQRLTIVAYDPPAVASGVEDLTEFVVRPRRDNVDLLSLGPKGSWRDYPQRRRRVARIVGRASPEWDVLLMRVGNRRGNLVLRPNRCSRLVSIIGGSSIERVRSGRALSASWRWAWPTLLAWRKERIHRSIMRRSQLVFANGEKLLEMYRRVVPDIKLLRSSARRARYAFLPEDRLATPDAQFLIAGRIKADKGVFEALEVFERIRRTVLPQAELHVAGTGRDLPVLEAEVRRRGLGHAVVFHGWLAGGDEFFGLIRRMDVLLCLSRVDFLPRVVWESLAHGVLVVCTGVGSLPVAFSDQEEVMIVPPGSVTAAVEAVERLAKAPHLRKRLLSKGYECAKQSTLEAVVGAILDEMGARWPDLTGREPSRLS